MPHSSPGACEKLRIRKTELMSMPSFRRPACALALGFALFGLSPLSAPLPAFAHGFKVGAIEVEHPWSRATPPGAKTGAGYFVMVNSGSEPDRLVSASSPAAEKTEIHEMSIQNGVMNMRKIENGLAIPAKGSAALSPGGYHLMLMGLKAPFKEGQMIPLTLTFEKAGAIDVELQVDKMGATSPSHGASAGEGEAHQH